MQYITAQEVAQGWGVLLRQVQRLLADNRIPYVKKYGRSWMIPAGTQKLVDPRSEQKPPENSLLSDLAYVPTLRHNPDSTIYAMDEERLRQFHEVGLAYAWGDF